MKILLISEFFPTGKDLKFSGGVEARNFYLAKHLAKKNNVVVLTSKTSNAPSKEKFYGFEVVRVGPKRAYLATAGNLLERISFILNSIKIGKKIDSQIVDGSNFVTHFIAKRIASHKKIPTVAWYPDVWIGQWFKNAGIYGIFGEILERINLKLGFDAYIAISKTTAGKLSKKISNKVNVIPCGIDKQEFGTNHNKSTFLSILCVSRLARYKNIKDLIFAFAHLSTKMKNINLQIVGTGPEYSNLKSLSRELKIEKKVKFLSNLSRKDLLEIYKSSYLFCLPSSVEGFGIAIIEAAASGLPYVVADLEVLKEVTERGKGGVFFKKNDIKDLVQKMEELLTDRNLYREKQIEGRILAKKYLWRDISKKTEAIYRNLLKINENSNTY